jgi:hypothetical protein
MALHQVAFIRQPNEQPPCDNDLAKATLGEVIHTANNKLFAANPETWAYFWVLLAGHSGQQNRRSEV